MTTALRRSLAASVAAAALISVSACSAGTTTSDPSSSSSQAAGGRTGGPPGGGGRGGAMQTFTAVDLDTDGANAADANTSEVVAATDIAHAVDHLVVGRVAVSRAEDGGLRPALDEAARHCFDIALRPAPLRVLGVAPVEQHDMTSLEGRGVHSLHPVRLPAGSVCVRHSWRSAPPASAACRSCRVSGPRLVSDIRSGAQ